MKRVYAEVGFGNESFLSTEVEEGNSEYRIRGFILPQKISGVYLRFWIFKKVFIISTNDGFEINTKDRNRLKILFGIGGEGLKLEFQDSFSEKREKILGFLEENAKVRNRDIENLFDVSDATATRYLDVLEERGLIVQKGGGRSTYYIKK